MPPTTKITEPGTTDEQPGNDPFGRPIEAPTQTMTPTHAVPVAGAPSVGVATGGDNCAACGAPMAADQRYCIACGERRGQARFSATPGAPGSTTTTNQVREPTPERHRFSAGTTLIAGVATLLLAMGVGVLIGSESSSSPTASNPKVQVVNVGGGGAAASAATTPATTSPSGGSSSKSTGKSHKNNAHAATTASTSSAASATTVKTPPPTVTVGAKGHGPGYQHGHFTGNFFGP